MGKAGESDGGFSCAGKDGNGDSVGMSPRAEGVGASDKENKEKFLPVTDHHARMTIYMSSC